MSQFYNPKTLAELCQLLGRHGKSALKIAGGTDLIIQLGVQALAKPKQVYINLLGIEELGRCKPMAGGLFLGSTATHAQLAVNPYLSQEYKALALACAGVGSPQIRNRGTIGGNLATGSPAGDLLPVLFALGARVQMLNSKGEVKDLAIEAFLLGKGQTALQGDEVILGVLLPDLSGWVSDFKKLGSRKEVTVSLVSAACCMKLDSAGMIEACRVYFGAIAPAPVGIEAINSLLVGQRYGQLTQGGFAEIFKLAASHIEQAVPKEFDRDYKRLAVKGVLADLFL